MAYTREERREYQRRWREANPDKVQQYNESTNQKRRGKPKPESAKRYHRKWYQKNRVKILEQAKAYAAAHPERCRAARRKWLKMNLGKRREWLTKNRPLLTAYQHARRAAKKAATVGDKKLILAFYRHVQTAPRLRCYYCRIPLPFGPGRRHVDHRIPLAKGGKHCVSNLVPACPSCNHRKSAMMPEQFTPTRVG